MQGSSFVAAMGLIMLAGQVASADGGPAHQVKQTPPIKLGTSGGEANDSSRLYCCGGTLGALVLYDGAQYILSNNHVLARSGIATTNEDTIQPGLIDSGCSTTTPNIVGDFAGNLVPLGTNVDTALSRARAGMVDPSGYIIDVGVPCANIQAPALNMPVMKSGRTTGYTTGTITSLNTSVTITYQKGCNSGKRFNVSYTNQVVSTAMSAGGDSGSVLLSNDGSPNPVGLLFAGSTSATIYNPIQDVVNAYSAGVHTFAFVGNTCPAANVVAPAPTQADFDRANQVKVESEHDLMSKPGIWGVGVGSAANNPLEAVIVVYMEKPKDEASGPKIPSTIDGINVRIIYTDPFIAQ